MTAFPRNPALEAALVADPDDVAALDVYGDWLQEHGSPHGELIHLQRVIEAEPRNVGLRRREAELLEAHGEALVGAAVVPRLHLLGWHRGFVRSAELTDTQALELCGQPAGLLLRDLTATGEWTMQPVIDRLAEVGPPLGRLQLALWTYDADEPHDLGDVGALWRRLPLLEQLELVANDVERGLLALGEIVAPRLRELVPRPSTMSADHLRAVAAGTLPALTHLVLWLDPHRDRYDDRDDRWAYTSPRCTLGVDELGELFASPLPALRHLIIANTTLGDALCDVLAASPLAPRLHSLGLIRGTITDAGAATLARHRAAFAQLTALDLDLNRIATASRLDGLPPSGPNRWQQHPVDAPACWL